MVRRVDEDLKRYIDNCTKCEGDLKNFTVLLGFPSVKSYCPNCDIIKMASGFGANLCGTCHSPSFYHEERRSMGTLENEVVKIYGDLYESIPVNERVGGGPVSRRKMNRLDLDVRLKEINKLLSTEICWLCLDDNTSNRIRRYGEYEKLHKRNELRLGYHLMSVMKERDNGSCSGMCDLSNTLVRTVDGVYRGGCNKCDHVEFFEPGTYILNKIREIKLRNNEPDSLETILFDDLILTKNVEAIPYSGEKDLMNKIGKLTESVAAEDKSLRR